MKHFEQLLARQKSSVARGQEVRTQALAHLKHTAAAYQEAPVVEAPSKGFTANQISTSNQIITQNCYRAELLAVSVLDSMPPGSIQLYTDNVFRLHREEHGIFKQIPVFLQM